MHYSHCFFHFWKQCSKTVSCIVFKSFVSFLMMSTAWNLLPLRATFSLGNRRKSGGRSQVNRGDFCRWKCICFCSSVKSLGTNFFEFQCNPESSIKIVTWASAYSNLFCNLSNCQSMIFTDNLSHLGTPSSGSQSWRSATQLVVSSWSSSVSKCLHHS
jgi:hypothetical protein